jgi:predicted acyltransferase
LDLELGFSNQQTALVEFLRPLGGGWSLLLLAFFHFTIDVLGYRRWAFFFIVIGMNAITIYMAQEIIPFDEIAEFFLGGAAGFVGSFDETLLEIGATGLKWGFVYFLFKHRIF